jgi:PAS domain S-box-containing protein
VNSARDEVEIVVAVPTAKEAELAVAVLERLGAEVRVQVTLDSSSCLTLCAGGAVDLVVAFQSLGSERIEILDALRDVGPPLIAVNEPGNEAAALDAFARGAADCVAAGTEFADVLPVVALEQIQRWRQVTARGAAERRIRDLEHYNENIIQNLNSALLVVDDAGLIVSVNPPAEEILGEDAAALGGRSLWDWFPNVPRSEVHVSQTLESGRRFKGSESVLTRRDGSDVPIGISCSPITDGAGERLGAVAVFSDLTEIRQLRRQFLQTEKMASIGQLAAGVAHEINNPMGFIHANLFQMAEYLADLRKAWESVDDLVASVDGGDLAAIRSASAALVTQSKELDVEFLLSDFAKAIRESQEGSERIRHIVHDLRDFSHHDAENRVLSDVNLCLESTANIVWPMMKHLVELEKEYGELPQVWCYPMQLKQVFMNLLVNAYQSIAERYGDGAQSGHIHLRTAVLGERVEIRVQDDGVGIEAANLDRIFDPFFTTKQVGSGTGLGLSTCFNIVERHGGVLRVESERGEGAAFVVELPCGVQPPTEDLR